MRALDGLSIQHWPQRLSRLIIIAYLCALPRAFCVLPRSLVTGLSSPVLLEAANILSLSLGHFQMDVCVVDCRTALDTPTACSGRDAFLDAALWLAGKALIYRTCYLPLNLDNAILMLKTILARVQTLPPARPGGNIPHLFGMSHSSCSTSLYIESMELWLSKGMTVLLSQLQQ